MTKIEDRVIAISEVLSNVLEMLEQVEKGLDNISKDPIHSFLNLHVWKDKNYFAGFKANLTLSYKFLENKLKEIQEIER